MERQNKIWRNLIIAFVVILISSNSVNSQITHEPLYNKNNVKLEWTSKKTNTVTCGTEKWDYYEIKGKLTNSNTFKIMMNGWVKLDYGVYINSYKATGSCNVSMKVAWVTQGIVSPGETVTGTCTISVLSGKIVPTPEFAFPGWVSTP